MKIGMYVAKWLICQAAAPPVSALGHQPWPWRNRCHGGGDRRDAGKVDECLGEHSPGVPAAQLRGVVGRPRERVEGAQKHFADLTPRRHSGPSNLGISMRGFLSTRRQ